MLQKKYHGFFLDADNTLFDFNKAERDALFETMETIAPASFSEEIYQSYHSINEEVWKGFEEGTINYSDLKTTRFSNLLKLLQLNTDPEQASELFLDRLSTKAYLLPHAIEVLEYLAKRASLVLISNGISRVQRGRIARAGIEIFFQDILISEEIGISKPEPGFFQLALKRLQLPPHKVLCIGDSPSADIRGGHHSGLDTCWFMYPERRYPVGEPKPDYIVTDLRELTAFSANFS